uniref:Uncharacterized protein n=1 Tax=Pseudo-nitzschia australis TaxID=44445 RepID=A0A7S4AGE4_9STRA|mmetsp:Transcript_27820/g.61267  ORF Transcript_27820/g.61267 Transcript_27820/m.61267 type:complete len:321 (-) Transcript_27820:427-1389(-)|eukprot:CAMPEP_0168182468 /NCGR_PEP_ID=MMETSP0139_2-20121125/11911_1 /TAXON_ID=44445 /ORGANISM="Pseudo-nitzschia australis, Strain 10249 10 AB" /LENGTH=320 /DNA_ID=CAMNT_0008103403 /DNA_START=106 /DNA_END=1068 /DNA_ORIENTATION=+
MKFQTSALLLAAAATSTNAFAPVSNTARVAVALKNGLSVDLPSIESQIAYQPGAADTDFARRFGGAKFVDADVRTVGEAFTAFTEEYGYQVNALYKNMVTDLVGTIHLITVNARFVRDPVWSLGILSSLELLLKNYPEAGMFEEITSALFKSVNLDEAEIRADAAMIKEWAAGKTKEEIEAALKNGDDSPLGTIATAIKGDEYWMYSRYFGVGLLKLMEGAGVEMDKDEVYPVMENWMSEQLGQSHLTACADSDLFFRVKDKLDMMETMMKEIEIREKKRMAERLEKKAEAALRAADREEKMQEEIKKEAAEKAEAVASE